MSTNCGGEGMETSDSGVKVNQWEESQETSNMDLENGKVRTEDLDLAEKQDDYDDYYGCDDDDYGEEEEEEEDDSEKIVYPWMGVVANVKTEVKDGRKVGKSGTNLRDELIMKGYNPVKVHPMWTYHGYSGISMVEFHKDWEGYRNALVFEKDFKAMQCGKDDYLNSWNRGEMLFGWIARDSEYNSSDPVGKFLRKKTDLKSLSDIVADGERKDWRLVSSLEDALSEKHEHLREMQTKFHEAALSKHELIFEKDNLTKSYNEEIRKMQQEVSNDLSKILAEHERAKNELEAQSSKLELQEKQLKEREEHNESEMKKLHHHKEMNKRAIMEQKIADEEMFRLAQEHQKEKDAMNKKVIELEAQLDAKQAVELEIEQMKGALQVMGHLEESESHGIRDMKEKLEEKEDELEYLVGLNKTLMSKQEMVESELDQARKELIDGLLEMRQAGRATIGVKRAGKDGKRAKGKAKLAGEDAELWHLKEDRTATLMEGLEFVVRNWKRLSKERRLA